MTRLMTVLVICCLVIFRTQCAHGGTCDGAVPPFIAAGVKSNVLVILDNSNSMDEDFYGNAVGSYSSVSKSVVAKKAVRSMIESLKKYLRVGLMTYRLNTSSVSAYYIHNSQYFLSYDPKSFCPEAPAACVEYCRTGSSEAKTACQTSCPNAFDPDYFDAIISTHAIGSEVRNRYCALVFPKTMRIPNPTDPGNFLYYKAAFPFYASSSQGDAFCYSEGADYSAGDGPPWDKYKCYENKTGTSDGFGTPSGYSTYRASYTFYPTDSDIALGYKDFGQRMGWYAVGRTWFHNGSPGNGYLQVPIGDLDNGTETTTYSGLWTKLDPKENDEMGYMSCTESDKNKCSYIVNAGLTPTAGTLQTAYNYYKGDLSGYVSPIQERCQKSFIVYVTDGLPSVNENGQSGTAESLMPAVLQKLQNLRTLKKKVKVGKKDVEYTFDVKTYILGVGLSAEAKTMLDQMAVKGGTDVDGHAYYADSAEQLNEALTAIFSDILRKTASGTSVSILSERAQKGSNVMQAVFYPEKHFDLDVIDWIGFLYNYWFYVSRGKSSLREDTHKDKILDLVTDYGIEFQFVDDNLRIARSMDMNADGEAETPVDTITLDEVKPLWEAGEELFKTSPRDRKIYTADASGSLVDFTDNMTALRIFKSCMGNVSSFQECLSGGNDNATAANLVKYIRGMDISGCRNRTVSFRGMTNTWKLGDVVYSTPKVAADYRICSDNESRVCDTDSDCGTGSCNKAEGLVFFGANDGMLHAVNAGILNKSDLTGTQVARLDGAEVGKEVWAFIPRNSLPYLRCLPRMDYAHLYYVDLSPYITKLKGRTILIGGMRFGGATCTPSKDNNYSCGAPSDTCGSVACADSSTCYNPANCLGLSSYFALDISHPRRPKFLWEFTHPKLGFSYSGPGVVRRDGKYFVVFASGPQTRDGDSEQNLHLFVLTLNEDLKIAGLYVKDFGSSFKNAFGGRLFTDGLDVNEDKNTDFLFQGFAYSASGQIDDWKGGIVKIWTGTTDPSTWDYNTTYFNAAQQPITAKVEFSKCFNTWYVYVGSGRYYFKGDNYSVSQNDRLMAVPFVCDAQNNCRQPNINFGHSAADVCKSLGDQGGIKGWYLELSPGGDGYYKERDITDPTITNQNVVFFTTTEPTAEVCGFGGRSRMWGLNCATGGAIADYSCPGYAVSTVQGSLFLQTSTGALNRINPNADFQGGSDNRTTEWYQGVPPETATPFVEPMGTKTGRVVHWIEK